MMGKSIRKISIIVVDDEPISADDMSDVIREEFEDDFDVDVRTAYNAKSVFNMMDDMPCDILVSDIQMPGMNGLEMTAKLRECFSDLRVLFLTGYDDFSYAYEAFRQQAVQYILKTEGDAAVLNAIRIEINRILEKERILERIYDAEMRYMQMVPGYRKQVIMELMLNQRGALDELEEKMLEGNIYLVIGSVQGSGTLHAKSKMITATAVSQIIKGSFQEELDWIESYLFDNIIIWVLCFQTEQPVLKTLFHLMRKARQQIEEQLKQTIFFIVSEEAAKASELDVKYTEIRTMLANEILKGVTGVAIRQSLEVEKKEPCNVKKVSEMRKCLENIQFLIRKGAISEVKNDINMIVEYLEEHAQLPDLIAIEASQALNAAILSYVNRNNMISLVIEAEKAGTMGSAAYFRKIQELMDHEFEKRVGDAVKSIIDTIVKYIHDHISENISASVLADVTGYSSGYLSKIFRKEMKMSLHEYVAATRLNLAKEMLSNTGLKIYEVAASCGFENTTYFIKNFKANTGMTPQDYRLMIRK